MSGLERLTAVKALNAIVLQMSDELGTSGGSSAGTSDGPSGGSSAGSSGGTSGSPSGGSSPGPSGGPQRCRGSSTLGRDHRCEQPAAALRGVWVPGKRQRKSTRLPLAQPHS